jgi:sarcosine oxidase subunit alpha
VTPADLGLEGVAELSKPFIGKRSLQRTDMLRADRKQLVGLLTEAPETVLPEGTQLVAAPDLATPVVMLGHVTSSYYSANCGRSIALALVKGGRERIGDTLYAALDAGVVKVTLTAPRFLQDTAATNHG